MPDGSMPPVAASARRRLPGRRLCDTVRVVHRTDGSETRFFVTVGYHPDEPMRPVEVFYSGGFRAGADLEVIAQDAAVLVSLLLQHGASVEDVAHSLARRENAMGQDVASSLIGSMVEVLAQPPSWAEELAAARSAVSEEDKR